MCCIVLLKLFDVIWLEVWLQPFAFVDVEAIRQTGNGVNQLLYHDSAIFYRPFHSFAIVSFLTTISSIADSCCRKVSQRSISSAFFCAVKCTIYILLMAATRWVGHLIVLVHTTLDHNELILQMTTPDAGVLTYPGLTHFMICMFLHTAVIKGGWLVKCLRNRVVL